MLKIKILSVGKTKEKWLNEAISEYTKRLSRTASIEFISAKDDTHLAALCGKELISAALDPAGKVMDSTQFAEMLTRKLEEGGARSVFVIGGPEGLPKSIKFSCELISLSRLTFTHQIARLILTEQIYRALEIVRGSQYHK